jgi:small subunit ribosomal protein S17e
MGRVRTKTIKRAAKVLLEKHYIKLTNDFHINKKILSEVAKVPTKSLRNKIAGYATHLVKRIQRGPVKGISLKVQEEERERRLDWVPKESEINIEKVPIALPRSKSMLKLTK